MVPSSFFLPFPSSSFSANIAHREAPCCYLSRRPTLKPTTTPLLLPRCVLSGPWWWSIRNESQSFLIPILSDQPYSASRAVLKPSAGTSLNSSNP
ncbi:DUF4442 domain-containing protein [Sesbania bispinosa]|nr:DUF4442 domain-containing protein [Sesbania bispinosa]